MSDLKNTLKALQKKYGENVVTFGSDIKNIRKISLGIPIFDFITTGGFPVNRITELYGDFSSSSVLVKPAVLTGNVDLITGAMAREVLTDREGKANTRSISSIRR